MTTTDQILKQKRQYFHQLLISLGEEIYKDVIVSTLFNVDSTTKLNEKQLDELIRDAKQRMAKNNKPTPTPKATDDEQRLVKMWRNKCLLVMNERGITAKPKDWTVINNELAKKQFQWVMSPAQIERGIINHKGLYAFTSIESLKKLFKQLCSIRDNEATKARELRELMLKN